MISFRTEKNNKNLKIMKFKNYVFTFLLSFILISCSKEDEQSQKTPVKKENSEITSFIINGKKAVINKSTKTINLEDFYDAMTALTPEIKISNNGSISPKSGVAKDFTKPVEYTVTSKDGSTIKYTVKVQNKLRPFTHKNKKYAIILDNKTWEEAATFAVSKKAYLVHINSQEEQDAVYNAIVAASITPSKTVAPDGGGASYLWLGGNDIAEEGKWIWDGNNDGKGTHFWQGKKDGTAVNGSYENWGKEPDDYGTGQDALGIAITDWPLGKKSQWNDIKKSNKLYFVIEYN